MPRADNNGVEIEYDTIGDPTDPALLLVMGFTAQLTTWDVEFCRLLADQGFHVIRFDNRDCGLSSKTEGDAPNVMALMMAARAGKPVEDEVPYTLSDMAADGLAVLDDLSVDAAHVVGASMGGMIVQQMAIEHPERVLSLTSIMSTTGAPGVGQGTQEAMTALFTPPPAEREAVIQRGVEVGRLIGGPHFDEEVARQRVAESFDRSFYPQGAPFQMAAIAKTGDRTAGLQEIGRPTLVIHGKVDPLIQVSGGEATAEAVPGAELLVLDEMGHDLPRPLWPQIVEAITANAARAATA
jgi:pimeloyl-ACP methyl ester carboxylesterase